MDPAHQQQLRTTAEIAAVGAINVISWSFQDTVAIAQAIASLSLTLLTVLWIIVQLTRFLQKWIREDHVFDKHQDQPQDPKV